MQNLADIAERRMAAESPPSAWDRQLDAIIASAPLACDHCGGAGAWMDDAEAACYSAEPQRGNADGALNWYEYQSRTRACGAARWRCERCGRVIAEPSVKVNSQRTGKRSQPCFRCGFVSREDACPGCGALLRGEVRVTAHGQHFATGDSAHNRCIQYAKDGDRLRRYLGREL